MRRKKAQVERGGGRRGGFLRTRWLPFLAGLTALLGALVVLQFAVGRVMTDRTPVTQYLWWVPALWSLAAAWGLWAVSAACGRLSLRTRGVMLRPLVLAGCGAISLWVVFGEWHLQRVVLRPAQAPRERTLRVLHWNQSAAFRMSDGGDLIKRENPDIAVVVNARYDGNRRELVQAMGTLAPGEREIRLDGRVPSFTEPGHFFSSGMGLVASRERILRAGVVRMEHVEGADPKWRSANDPGFVVWCEIDAGERFADLGRPLVVWVVDFPSDPTLWRRKVMEAARDAVSTWEQAAMVCDEDGRWSAQGEPVRVPAPDIVMGDFNTLRGSASIGVVTPGMRDAFAQAGWGRARSWQQQSMGTPGETVSGQLVRMVSRWVLPLADWHIDLTRVGQAWRATRYRLVRPGNGPHDVQVVDLTPSGKK